MNTIIKEYYPILEMYQALRNQLMEILTDNDLAFQPKGVNQSLGMLCKEIGEIETAYIQSFKSFTQDFSYQNETPRLAESVEKLTTWFQELDDDLRATIASLSEDDIENRKIDRGGGFTLLPKMQLEVYKEALLIFCGKVSVYLKAMGKTVPEQWQEWIG